jgi:hypothetical protein
MTAGHTGIDGQERERAEHDDPFSGPASEAPHAFPLSYVTAALETVFMPVRGGDSHEARQQRGEQACPRHAMEMMRPLFAPPPETPE